MIFERLLKQPGGWAILIGTVVLGGYMSESVAGQLCATAALQSTCIGLLLCIERLLTAKEAP